MRIFPLKKYEEGEESYVKREANKLIAPFLSSNDSKEIKYRIIIEVELLRYMQEKRRGNHI